MKIAFLNLYNGIIDRGAETFVKELAQRLSKTNDVTVFQGGEKQGFEKYKVKKISINFNPKKKSKDNVLLKRAFLDYQDRSIISFTLKSVPEIWKNRYDVVVPVNGGWMPAILRIVTWLYGGRLVITGQSGIGWDDRNNLWCFPNVFVALSTKAKKWAKRVNPFVKTVYIPNGADIKRFHPEGSKFKTRLKKPIVLCVAALTPTKRVDLVIKAVSKLKDTSLLIAGDGDLKNEIDKLGRRLLGDRFQIIKVPFEKMPSVYRACDVFTIPSMSYYAFEIVLVEAMASGLPVVANKDEIRKEIIGNAGYLVDPVNTEAYSNSIKKALNTDWGNKPRKQAQGFDWNNISKKYEELFQEIIK